MYKEFFEAFDIPPMTRKGETFYTNVGRFAECIAKEDHYPTLNNDFIVEMENELLTYKPISELSLDCSSGEFNYCFQLEDPSDVDDWNNLEFGEGITRLDALIALLMGNVDRYKSSVRKVISKITNWDLKPINKVESIPVTFTVTESPCGSLGYKHLEE